MLGNAVFTVSQLGKDWRERLPSRRVPLALSLSLSFSPSSTLYPVSLFVQCFVHVPRHPTHGRQEVAAAAEGGRSDPRRATRLGGAAARARPAATTLLPRRLGQ